MKYILLAALLITTACCTPEKCPPQEIYINAVMQDGSETLVRIPEGAFNDPDHYYTKKEFESLMKEILRRDGGV